MAPGTGLLTLLQQQDCGGRNPVHLALSPDEGHLVVSNHLSSLLAVLPVQADGMLGPVAQSVPLPGEPGPHRQEQPFAKPHFNPFTPDGRHVAVPDKGVDRVFSFRFEHGRLTPCATPWFQSREGSGPRHLAFHPARPWAYVVNELDSTVTACRYAADTGALQPFQIVSALPDDFVGHSRASEIAVAPNGRTVYASNRGYDSIAVFRTDPDTGRLRWLGAEPSQGRTPRFFTLSPCGRWMYVLNEDSDGIAQFAVDADTGGLRYTGHQTACGSPVCMVFSPGRA
ncbi:MAG: lactonase family protein [Burkholderiaceae bacterium]|nr:MAG: lactonase family protein [Burkholderiaceae bacterium]